MTTVDYDGIVDAVLKGENPFRDLRHVRETFTEWKQDYEIGKFYMAHVIASYLPELITLDTVEDALLIAMMMGNGYYLLVNSCTDDEVRSEIISYFNNRFINSVSIVDAVTSGIISTDLAIQIIITSMDNGNLTMNDIDIVFCTMAQQSLSVHVESRGEILLMMCDMFSQIHNMPTVQVSHKTIMARSIYDMVKNIDVDIFGQYLANLVVEDYFTYLTPDQYQLLKDYKSVSQGIYN